MNEALPAAIAVSSGVAAVLVVILWPVVSPVVLFAWLLMHLLVSAGRLLVVRRSAQYPHHSADIRRWLRYAVLGALCAGLIWGAASSFLFLYSDPLRQAFQLVAIAGISAGAVTSLRSLAPAALAFLVPTLAPAVTYFLVTDIRGAVPMATLAALALVGFSCMAYLVAERHTKRNHPRSRMRAQRDEPSRDGDRYRALVESTSAILWEKDPETFRFTFASGEVETLLGYPLECWLEEPSFWLDHMHPDDATWVPEHCARAASTPGQDILDYRMIAADGSTVWLRDTMKAVFGNDRPVKLVGTMIDVTEIKEAEQKLRQQEEHYRSLVESTSAIFWEEDPATLVFTFVSREAENVLGYPVASWLGNRNFWIDHLHPDDREWVPRKYEENFRNQRRCSYDYRMIDANGRIVWLRDVATVLTENGKPVKNVGVMFDITETRQAESVIDYLSELQQMLVDVSRQLMVTGPDRTDEIIERSLARVGAYCEVDRSYLFRFRSDLQVVDKTHEWCADGVSPQFENLQNLGREDVPMFIESMERNEVLYVPRVADLNPEWKLEHELLEAQSIRSMIAVPVVVGETVHGFIGFDSVRGERRWSDSEARLLRVLSDLLGARIVRDEVERALKESEQLRSHAETLANLGSWEWDVQRDEFTASQEWRRVTGCHDRKLARERVLEIAHPQDLPAINARLARTLETGAAYELEHRIIRQDDGAVRWVLAHAEAVVVAGRTEKLYGFIQDITNRRMAEEAVAESEKRYRSVVDSISEVVFRTDADGLYTFLNPAWEEITGYPIDQTIGTHFLDYIHPEDRAYCEDEYGKLLRGDGDSTRIELRYLVRNGETRWIETDARVTYEGRRRFTGCTGTLRDVTERLEAEERMIQMAHYDALTNLPNRTLALDRVEQALKGIPRTGAHVAALFLDLDYFKKVNDTLGHDAGDQALIEAAHRLTATVRSRDTVARLGGDEFLVILGEIGDSTDVQMVALSLLHQFREPFVMGGRELVLTASIGIAMAPTDGNNAAELLRNADTAMYQSKNEGRDTFHFFTPAMNREVARRLSIEEQLRGALAREEFEVIYQPLIRVEDRGIVGAEALLRWHNPVLGNVAPAEFIPIAEQSNQINVIGDHVLDQALTRVAQWRRGGHDDVVVAVNVSPQQFRDARLIEKIEALLNAADVPGEALEVEVTEGLLLSGRSEVGRVLAQLRNRGIGIAMDDFGTGYASLSYLRDYPFDTLKIDQSFVHDIDRDDSDRELVVTSLRLAQGLGLRAVAEGVESEEQLSVLIEHGCKVAQGHLFGEAMDGDRFARMLDESTASETSGTNP